MTDYRIEAATKEEWAERALRAEAKLADTAIGYKKRCEVLEERWEAACQDAREAEAKLAAERERAYNAGRKHERDLIYVFAQRMDTEGKAYAEQILAAIRKGDTP